MFDTSIDSVVLDLVEVLYLKYQEKYQYDYICVARNRVKDYELNLSQQRIQQTDEAAIWQIYNTIRTSSYKATGIPEQNILAKDPRKSKKYFLQKHKNQNKF